MIIGCCVSMDHSLSLFDLKLWFVKNTISIQKHSAKCLGLWSWIVTPLAQSLVLIIQKSYTYLALKEHLLLLLL